MAAPVSKRAKRKEARLKDEQLKAARKRARENGSSAVKGKKKSPKD